MFVLGSVCHPWILFLTTLDANFARLSYCIFISELTIARRSFYLLDSWLTKLERELVEQIWRLLLQLLLHSTPSYSPIQQSLHFSHSSELALGLISVFSEETQSIQKSLQLPPEQKVSLFQITQLLCEFRRHPKK